MKRFVQRTSIISIGVAMGTLGVTAALAAVAGLPFTEDFTASNLQDTTTTTANWNTTPGQVVLPEVSKLFGSLDAAVTLTGTISTDLGTMRSVASGDVDGDGDLDLVVARDGDTNRLYVNNGTSTPFSGVTGTDIGTESNPSTGIALADLDLDGDLDVVVANNSSISNQYYLNNGTSTPFSGVTAFDIGTADTAYSVAVADVNADTYPDIVFGTNAENVLYLNNGTSTPFSGVAAQQITADSAVSTAIALADMNNDQMPDVIVGNFSDRMRFYLNDGSGNPFDFFAGTDIGSTNLTVHNLAVADVNADGYLDIAVGTDVVANKVILNSQNTNPFDTTDFTDVGTNTGNSPGMALQDIDSDGDFDAVSCNWTGTVMVTKNTGTALHFAASLAENAAAAVNLACLDLVVADFDNDGDLDTVLATSGNGLILFTNGASINPFTGGTQGAITADTFDSKSITYGDVNNDGVADIIIGTNGGTEIKRYLGNGDGTFGSSANVGTDTDDTEQVTLYDMNNDGSLDVLAANNGSTNKYYLGNGDGTFATGVAITADTDTTYSLAIGDLNHDGLPDIVATNRSELEQNRVYLNDGVGVLFETTANVSTDADQTYKGILADMNNDGNLDLVLGVGFVSSRLHLGNGDGTFAASTPLDNSARNTSDILVEDIDNDGDLDVIEAAHLNLNRVLINDGVGDPFDSFISYNISGFSSISPKITAADFDNDGDIDIIIPRATTNGFTALGPRIILNDGVGNPFDTLGWIQLTTTAVDAVQAVDVNNDGQIDVVGTRYGNPDVVLLNNGYSIGVSALSNTNISSTVCSDIQLADVDVDGDLDLVIGLGSVNEDRILLNDGVDTPFDTIAEQDITNTIGRTDGFMLADMNNDGFKDMVLVNETIGLSAQLLLHSATASVYNGQPYTNITSDVGIMYDLAVADMNNDGKQDVVVSFNNAPNRLYLNDGSGDPFDTTIGTNITTDFGATLAIAVGDVNHDGWVDVVTGVRNSVNRVYLNDGSGDPFDTVTGTNVSSDTNLTREINLADVNNDGHLDLVELNGTGINYLYLGNGDGTFMAKTAITNDSHNTFEANVVDFDRDGDLDLLVANRSEKYYLYANDGSGDPFDTAVAIDLGEGSGNWQNIAIGDVDNDGDTDIVACDDSGVIRLRQNRAFLYATNASLAQSIRIDTETTTVNAASLVPQHNLNLLGKIQYWLSSNGGTNWKLAASGATVNFTSAGNDVRWKAVLQSLSPIVTPVLTELTIERQVGSSSSLSSSSSSSSSVSSTSSATTTGGGSRGGSGLNPNLMASQAQKNQVANEDSGSTSGNAGGPMYLQVLINGQLVTFTDVPANAWFTPFVQLVLQNGIANGYKDESGQLTGEFGVENNVTYAEVIKMILSTAQETVAEAVPVNSSAQDQWSAKYIALAEQKQLSLLLDALDVNQAASRAEVVQIAIELLHISAEVPDVKYTDVPTSHPNYNAIAIATSLGFISGDTFGNTFRPNEPINRAEVAKILSKIFTYLTP